MNFSKDVYRMRNFPRCSRHKLFTFYVFMRRRRHAGVSSCSSNPSKLPSRLQNICFTQTQDFRWSCRNNKKISKHYHDKLWIHIWRRKIYHKHTERKSHTEFQVSFKTKLQNKRINGKSQQCYKIKFSPLVYKIPSIRISMM